MTKSDVTQIKIGKHKVGFVGLKKTFKDIAALYSKQPDDVVAEELLNRLSKNTQEEKWTNPYL
jgi:hypothetical protein